MAFSSVSAWNPLAAALPLQVFDREPPPHAHQYDTTGRESGDTE